jgi:hypothetical protein
LYNNQIIYSLVAYGFHRDYVFIANNS